MNEKGQTLTTCPGFKTLCNKKILNNITRNFKITVFDYKDFFLI